MSEFILKPFQARFTFSKARHPAFVGGWNVGKTLTAISRSRIYSKGIPENLGVIFRKTFRSLQDSTIKDFENYTGLKLDGNRNLVDPNGSITMFRHIDELDSINQQNINLGWFYIEQGEELESDKEFFMLFGRLRRKLIPSKEFLELGLPERSGWVIGNAGDNWMRPLWKDRGLIESQKQVLPDYVGKFAELIEATTWDNQENAQRDFLDSLKILERQNPALYAQFVMNDWTVATENRVFVDALINHCFGRQDLLAQHGAQAGVAVDPAEEGPDDNVFMAGRGGEVLEKFKKTIMSHKEQAILAVEMCHRIKGSFIIVDCDGFGIITYEALMELPEGFTRGIEIIKFHGSAPSEALLMDRRMYENKRAEAAFVAQRRGWAGLAAINISDKELVQDLKADKFFTNNKGFLQIIPKKDIREVLRRSPGCGDAWKMLQYAFDQNYEDHTYEDREGKLPAYANTDSDIRSAFTPRQHLPSYGRTD